VLRINRVHFPVTALGPGRRLGVWVQGCPLGCAGCIARDTWEPEAGRAVSTAELTGLWRDALAAGADGLTVSGGEPLAQPAALGELLSAAAALRTELGNDTADLLVYTGYEPGEITGPAASALEQADAVITGRFDVTRPTRLIWRGSANQVIRTRTPLGARRYEPYLNYAPDKVPFQVAASGGDLWFIGVPRQGDLPRLERALRRRGVTFGAVSWRP
jgi:anaerobic ribonucleoside-triphosphate reductase activating protein